MGQAGYCLTHLSSGKSSPVPASLDNKGIQEESLAEILRVLKINFVQTDSCVLAHILTPGHLSSSIQETITILLEDSSSSNPLTVTLALGTCLQHRIQQQSRDALQPVK